MVRNGRKAVNYSSEDGRTQQDILLLGSDARMNIAATTMDI